jgi:hypothetical protein
MAAKIVQHTVRPLIVHGAPKSNSNRNGISAILTDMCVHNVFPSYAHAMRLCASHVRINTVKTTKLQSLN